MEPKRIDWEEIDLWLQVLKHRHGILEWLCAKFDVSKSALVKRRRELKLPPLPRGPRSSFELTAKELAAVVAYKQGKSMGTIAKETGTTRQNVSLLLQSAQGKQVSEVRYCAACDGIGVVRCRTCAGIGPHFHVCLTCGGNSTTVKP